MNSRKRLVGVLSAVFCLSALTAYSRSGNARLANELRFDLDTVSQIVISYDEESVTFFQSDDNDLVIKEYMTDNDRRYYAKTEQTGGSIHVREGNKPFFKSNYVRYVEVYVPVSYGERLGVTTTCGSIVMSDVSWELSELSIESTSGTVNLANAAAAVIRLTATSGTLKLGSITAGLIELKTSSGVITCNELNGNAGISGIPSGTSEISIESTSGTVNLASAAAAVIRLTATSGTLKLGNITADRIEVKTSNGMVTCRELDGNVTYMSTNGSLKIKAASGSGNYRAESSGSLEIVYTEVTGDLSFSNKNGSINVTVPEDLEFEFEATVKNGSVSAAFQESVLTDGKTVRATVGSNPSVTIKAETNNGNIRVTQ